MDHSFISQFEGHVKESTLLFKKGRGSFLNGVVGGRLAQIVHIMSWVGYGKLINGPITETSETVVCWRPSRLTVNISSHLRYFIHLLVKY